SRPSRGNRGLILAAPTKIVGGFATDGRTYQVSRPQTRLAGVAVPSETASRLIANVWSRGESQRYDETLQMEACVLDWCRFDLVSLSGTLCL
ncbi:MAG: hypothetical protein QF569_26520, partial [Candidatus Poribacteria bacterium]|nr:hypothetical protein [Candidatus Poribacteria bacterium]